MCLVPLPLFFNLRLRPAPTTTTNQTKQGGSSGNRLVSGTRRFWGLWAATLHKVLLVVSPSRPPRARYLCSAKKPQTSRAMAALMPHMTELVWRSGTPVAPRLLSSSHRQAPVGVHAAARSSSQRHQRSADLVSCSAASALCSSNAGSTSVAKARAPGQHLEQVRTHTAPTQGQGRAGQGPPLTYQLTRGDPPGECCVQVWRILCA